MYEVGDMANYHRMLHRKRNTLTIQELKTLIKER